MQRILVLILLTLASCKVEKQLQKISDKHPEKIARYCAEQFPYDGTETSTVIEHLPGDTVYLPSDTVRINCDTAKGVQAIPCPPSKIIHDTVKKEVTKKIPNKAKEIYLQFQKDSLTALLNKRNVTVDSLQSSVSTFESKVQKKNTHIWKLTSIIVAAASALVLYLAYKLR